MSPIDPRRSTRIFCGSVGMEVGTFQCTRAALTLHPHALGTGQELEQVITPDTFFRPAQKKF